MVVLYEQLAGIDISRKFTQYSGCGMLLSVVHVHALCDTLDAKETHRE